MRKKIVFCLVIVVVLFVFSSISYSAKVKVRALGKYDFYHYYTYQELTDFLHDIQEAFPGLTELRTLCKSQMGRDVWMLVINNPNTGKPEEKPGFFLNQIHSSEVIASMSCLYTIWFILDNYQKKENVTQMVDNLSWYIVPRLDVDGAEAYLTGKPAGKDPDPEDADGDSKYDEDPPEDIDGDGYILQMRQVDPEGDMKISANNPRIMVKKAPDESGEGYYKLYTEGFDNDGDGKINEDGFRTRFLSNRNYPGNWKPQTVQRGGGRYPMEEGVTRAEVDFVASQPHIAIYVQHHCCGRVILRPPTTSSDSEFKNKTDLELFRVISARGLEHSGWDLATSIFDWNYPPGTPNRKSNQVYRDKDGNIRNAPSNMYPEKKKEDGSFSLNPLDEDCDCDQGYYAWGSSIDTMYDLFGIFSIGDEHWSVPDYDHDGNVTEEERFKWNDSEMEGKIFIDWHPFEHPTLGKVEIGGWRRRKVSPPEGELIQKECEMGNRFTMYLSSLAPSVKIGKVEIKDMKGGIFRLDLTARNSGLLPTATQQAQSLGIVDPVILEIKPHDSIEMLFGEKKAFLGHIKGFSDSQEKTYIFRVISDHSEPYVEISVKSQKAGRDTKKIYLR